MTVLPELFSKGLYTFKEPFATAIGSVELECKAIRSFDEIYNSNTDVFEEFYNSNSLDLTSFNTDRVNKVSIITFTKSTGEFIEVPSSYVDKIPSGGTVPYSHIVVSVSLSSIPDAMDLSFLTAQLAATTTAVLGLTPLVSINKAPTLLGSIVTDAQHAAMETSRTASVTNQVTDRGRLVTMTNAYNELKIQYDALAQAVADGVV